MMQSFQVFHVFTFVEDFDKLVQVFLTMSKIERW
jgi:hypothetical protein